MHFFKLPIAQLFTLSFLLVFMCTLPAKAATINDIEVNGNQRIEASTILSYLELKEGDNFENEKVNDSIKRMFDTGLFSNISIKRRGKTLVVDVVENPIINKVVFEGNKRIKEDSITPEILLKPRAVYTKAKVRQDVKRIQNLYRKSGRFSVTVVPKVIQLEQNRVNLVFEINEGKKATVKKIYFIGNKFFNSNKLKKVINTSESKWYSFYSGNDTYDPDKVAFDKEVLRKFYTERGFADFKVTSVVAEITKNKESFILTFNVEEGTRYKFGAIDVKSKLKDVTKESLDESIVSETGDVFNSREVETSIDGITDILNDLGYAFVDVRNSYKRNKETKTLDVTYNIAEGPKVYIDRINISGNVRTTDEVIRREFRIGEGDPYNAAKIRRSTQRIRNLGFFENVELDSEPSSEKDKATINVKVKEKPTGELNFGAGFSTTEGALGNVSIRERNLLGKGQDLRLGFEKSTRSQQIDLGFTEPYFMGRDVAAGFDIFNTTRDQGDESSFSSNTDGFTLRSTYTLSEHLRHNVRYSYTSVDITDIEVGASAFITEQEGVNETSLIGHSLIYDKRDNKFEPSEGYLLRASQDFAGLGGDSKYFKHELRAEYYYPVYEDDVILKLSGRGGNITGYDDREVRINERFFIGGDTIRGFDVAGIGPRDRTTRDALGGKNYYASSAEVMFPVGLPEELGFKASVFVDAGSLFDTEDGGTNVLDEPSVRASAGVGFSWSSPLGPIRVDVAEAFASEELDDTETIRFNFGTRF